MGFGMQAGWCSDDAESARIVDRYIELGGNFIDTANFYGTAGGSERVLGKLIGSRREWIVLSTKYTLTMRPGDPNSSGNHRKNMVQSVENSLKRLETDYIDLLYLHMWDSRTPVEEILRAFDDLVRAGKILYVGISDSPAWQIARMQAIAEMRGWSPIVALQVPYNLTQRTVERDLLPMACEMGIGVLPWAPLAGGVLSGKYSLADLEASGAPGALDSRKDINRATGLLTKRNIDIADVVKVVAQETGKTPSQVALAWTLLNPAVVSPLIGARTVAQLEDNLGSLTVEFTAEQRKRLDEVSGIDMGFPHEFLNSIFMAHMFGGVKVEMPRAR
jgi:aryl-alcohol dehydrogenase-like predicted oxidoreductase